MTQETVESLIAAIKGGNFEEIKELVKNNHNIVNTRLPSGHSAVILAAYYNQPTIARYLVEQGASLDIFEATAVNEHERVARFLEEQPELVNAFAPDGFTPLGLASFFGYQPLVEHLLAHGASATQSSNNAQKVTPLHSAAAGQHLEIAAMLLAHGAEVNAQQEGGFTPLHAAAQNGQPEMIELFLKYGADPDFKNAAGKTPRDLAREAGRQTNL